MNTTASPEDRGGHPNRTNLYDSARHEDTDKAFPGLKMFQIHSQDGGVNHFHANSVQEGIQTLADSVASVGKNARFGYTIHDVHNYISPNLQIGGGVMHSTMPHPNDKDQRPRLLNENKPQFNPRLPF